MIDFKNNSQIFKMKEVGKDTFVHTISPFMLDDEETISCYKAARDYVVFTNKRMIVVDVQGLIGKKQDFTSLPYNKIQAFSVKTAGALDVDTDVELAFAGLGIIHLEFTMGTDIGRICKMISGYVLA